MTHPNDPQQPDYGAYEYPTGSPDPAPGQTPGYGQAPAYGAAGGVGSTWAMAEEKNRVAPWALGLGILALLMGVSVLFSGFAFLAGGIGLILAIIALVRGRGINGPARRTGMSVAGLVMSVIGIVLSIVFWVVIGAFLTETGISECMSISNPDAQRICLEDALDEWANAGSNG